MRWFTSVSVAASVAVLFWAPAAYACPLCFGSSAPGVLRAYLVSAFFMIGLAWAVIGGIWLYAARMYPEKAEAGDTGAYSPEAAGPIQNTFERQTLLTQINRSRGTQETVKG